MAKTIKDFYYETLAEFERPLSELRTNSLHAKVYKNEVDYYNSYAERVHLSAIRAKHLALCAEKRYFDFCGYESFSNQISQEIEKIKSEILELESRINE